MNENSNKKLNANELLFNSIDRNDGFLIKSILENNEIDVLEFLMNFGYSPLEYALEIGNLDAAKALIDSKISLNMYVTLHPLEVAISFNQIGIIKMLLESGVDVNKDLGEGWNFLMRAAVNGNLTAAKLLVAAGAVVDKVTQEGLTAKSIALREDFYELSNYLNSYQA